LIAQSTETSLHCGSLSVWQSKTLWTWPLSHAPMDRAEDRLCAK
jgi:hypothetical protein